MSIHVEIHQTLSSLLRIYKPSALEKKLLKSGMGLVIINQMKLKIFWHQLMIIISLTSGKLLVFYLHPMPPNKTREKMFGYRRKTSKRKFWPLCKTFSAVKWLFKFETNHQKFDFPKLHQYAPCS